jgi:hypothetical protein
MSSYIPIGDQLKRDHREIRDLADDEISDTVSSKRPN